MANVKISELTALTPPDAADLVPVTDSSASQTKRTTVGEIVGIINGDVDVADDGTATISELPVSKVKSDRFKILTHLTLRCFQSKKELTSIMS